MANNALSQRHVFGAQAPKPPLYGIYNVNKYIVNGKEMQPLTTDEDRWKQIVIEYKDFASIKTMDDRIEYFKVLLDQKDKKIELTNEKLVSTPYKFKYQVENDSTLVLTGTRNQDSLVVTLNKYNLKNIRLINRGFHWINEYPNNR